MRILYIGYWNLNDPLTVSTVFPSLEVLNASPDVERIIFTNVEREKLRTLPERLHLAKIEYYPYASLSSRSVLKEKISDFMHGTAFIRQLVTRHNIDVMIARGAPAGALAWLVWRELKIPFLVESFEPHAQYMIESGVWKWYDIRYWVQRFYERNQKKNARGLMPVAENYRTRLIEEGIDERRVFTVPCPVDILGFAFSERDRTEVRHEMELAPNAVVGIYAGRFGGLYLEDESFLLYRGAFDFFGDQFNLVLLTPSIYHDWIRMKILQFKLPGARIFVRSVDHEQVPRYLSASDFGFATYKPGESKSFLSPVKIAEYWANGLPILLTKGIGDENDMLIKFPYAGVLFDAERIEELVNEYFVSLKDKLKMRSDPASPIPRLASRYRSLSRVHDGYQYFLKQIAS